jgi:hypothetical protein
MPAVLPEGTLRGRRYIIVDEWGPYDFRRPLAAVDTIVGTQHTLMLLGPAGDWKITEMKGVKNVSVRKGVVPGQLTFERDPAEQDCSIAFEYSGVQMIVTEFGKKVPPGTPYRFLFRE